MLNFAQKRIFQDARVARKPIDKANFAQKTVVLCGCVVACIDTFELFTALCKHKAEDSRKEKRFAAKGRRKRKKRNQDFFFALPQPFAANFYPKNPRKLPGRAEYFGNNLARSLLPKCLKATSANTSRKSVVNARSRPSLSWSLFNPFQSP